MGRMYICTECGQDVYSVCSYDFGSGHFCEPCYEKLNLGELIDEAESFCSQIDFCDPRDNLGLYLEQLETQDKIYDAYYHQLKTTQLK